MPVYMIRAGEKGPVKIGRAQDIRKRLTELQVFHWEKLRIMRAFTGGVAEEAMLHDLFYDLHLRGEWHHFSRAMLADVGLPEIDLKAIGSAPQLRRRSRTTEDESIIQTAIKKAGSVKEFGKLIGRTPQCISQWKQIPTEHVRAVGRLLGLPACRIRPDVFDAEVA